MINGPKLQKITDIHKYIDRKETAAVFFSLSILVSLMLLSRNNIQTYIVQVYAAPLRSQAAIPSNNIVSTTSTYEITFNTATAGQIRTIEIAFPAGYNVAGTSLIETAGIGSGTISRTGNTVIYTAGSPSNVGANTPIRLELANIVNTNAGQTASISITTKASNGNIIDGPTAASTPVKNISNLDIANSAVTTDKIGPNAVTNTKIADGDVITNDLADNAVTSQKIGDGQVAAAELSTALMYTKRLFDTNCVAGAAPGEIGPVGPIGWCPDGAQKRFVIRDSDLVQVSFNQPKNILVSLPGVSAPYNNCWANTGASDPNYMTVDCAQPPVNGASLTYTVIGPKVLP